MHIESRLRDGAFKLVCAPKLFAEDVKIWSLFRFAWGGIFVFLKLKRRPPQLMIVPNFWIHAICCDVSLLAIQDLLRSEWYADSRAESPEWVL